MNASRDDLRTYLVLGFVTGALTAVGIMGLVGALWG